MCPKANEHGTTTPTRDEISFDQSNDKEVKEENYFMRWSRIQKTVDVDDGKTGGLMGSSHIGESFRGDSTSRKNGGNATRKKHILNQVSAYAAPGEVLACMGPSGSGKTSLLNILSGRSAYNSGVISINGKPISATSMKYLMSKIAYVKQQDLFFEHLTVQDQFTYTALLRLPSSISNAEKVAEVDRLVKMLRLGKVAQSPIRLISGGEKKRVNIGTELLTNPRVLMLDEPTSGLDSTSAMSLIKLLQNLAVERKTTIITTIHQPSSAVFQSFDRLLMISEGHVVYFGTPTDSLSYIRQQNMACPDGYNLADHWMDLLVKDDHSSLTEDGEEEAHLLQSEHANKQSDVEEGSASASGFKSTRFLLQRAWDNEAVAESLDATLKDDDSTIHTTNSQERERSSVEAKYATSWATQYGILTHRCLKGSRSAIFTPLNMIKSGAIGIVAGLAWWQTDYTEKTITDRSGYFFFTMSYWVFEAMFSSLLSFPPEKAVILKERASASYHLSAYFLAKTTSDVPVRLVLPCLYMAFSFWLAGIDTSVGVFAATTGCTLMSVMAGEALGLCVGAAIPDMTKALTVMTVTTLALMLVGGFFVDNIPDFVIWLKYLSPFKYAFDSALGIAFNRPMPCDGSGVMRNLCEESSTGIIPTADVIEFLGVQGSVGFNIAMLAVICMLPRYVAYLSLRRLKGGERD